MTQYVIANNVSTQLATAVSSTAIALTLASATNLPTLSAGQIMPLTLNDAATGSIYEIVYVTAISGVTLTVTRAQEGTGAQSWNVGDYAYCAPTAGTVATTAGNSAQTFAVGAATTAVQAPQMGQIQAQSGTAFTAAGTAPAYTLAPSPAIQVYASPQRFNVTFPAAGTTGSNTINVSGLGAIPIKQFAADGSLVSGIVTAGMNSDVQIVGAGSYALLLDPLPGTAIGVRGVRSNLAISYTGTSGVVSVTANELSLESAAGAYVTLKNLSLSATSGNASGAANSLDAGSWAFSTWYNLFVIYNPTTQTSALLWSLSATAPTMPSGYTYFARIGANKTQSATSYFFLGGNQRDKTFRYLLAPGSNVTSIPLMASGAAGSISTPTWVSVATGSFVPATAPIIAIGGMSAAGATIMVAPSASYGALGSLTITAPYVVSATSGTTPNNSVTNITLESTSLYWCNNSASSSLFCFGWEDNL